MKKAILLKIVTVLTLICILSLSLIGCSDQKITAFMNTDLANAMASRVSANKALVNKLYVSGLISENEKEKIEKNIDSQMSVYLGNIAENKELQKKLFSAIVDWSIHEWSDYGPESEVDGVKVNSFSMTEEEWTKEILTNYIQSNQNILKQLKERMNLFNGVGSTVIPISIIDSKTGELINERFGYKVYVLKSFGSSDTATTTSGSRSLDEVLEMIAAATTNKNKIDNSVLDQFFTQAVDENGSYVTLLDISKKNNQIISDSTGSTIVSESKYVMENGKLKKTTVGNKVITGIKENNKTFHTPEDEANPGKDMVIKDQKTGLPLMAIRFHEFNSEAIDNIISTLGMSPDQYLFTTYGGENRVYIMEYPAHYVSAINDSKEKNEYECEFSESNMGINIRTGKLIKYGTAWGEKSDLGVYFEDKEPYLPVKGATSSQEEGRSAFIIEGETPEDYSLEIGENKSKVKTGRIILRDYLEATYAPKIVSNENMVVFGRKIRILQFKGSKNNVVARFYDKDGKVLENGATLMIDDFADFQSLKSEQPIIKYIGRIGENYTAEENEEITGETDSSDEDEDYTTHNIRASIVKVDELSSYVVDRIEPTTQFPGLDIGSVDYEKSNRPLFYAIAIKKNMFDTALFSSWINKADIEKNSLDWWNHWLAKLDYKYKINKTSLEEYLMGNYTFELQEEGIIIVDSKTISKIQEEYIQQDKDSSMRWFRTTFIVLGYVFICYAFILLLAWMVDTNVDLGFNILEKLSFGHWIAIKDPDEMPYTDLGVNNSLIL